MRRSAAVQLLARSLSQSVRSHSHHACSQFTWDICRRSIMMKSRIQPTAVCVTQVHRRAGQTVSQLSDAVIQLHDTVSSVLVQCLCSLRQVCVCVVWEMPRGQLLLNWSTYFSVRRSTVCSVAQWLYWPSGTTHSHTHTHTHVRLCLFTMPRV